MQGKRVPGVGGIVCDIRTNTFSKVTYTAEKAKEWKEAYQELALRNDLFRHPDLWQKEAKAAVVASAIHLCEVIDPENVIAPGTTWTADEMSQLVAERQENGADQS